MFRGTLAVLFTAVLMVVGSMQLTAAAPPADTYQANYFLGVTSGSDASITILDPGTNGTGNLCADIYVLNPSEELEACCSCVLTPDEILNGSVSAKLLSNNVSPIVLTNGVIKIVSDSKCNAGAPTPTPAMRAWLTRSDSTGTTSGVTTTQFASATLSAGELTSLSVRCADIILVGSGFGSCSCPLEPPNH